MNSKNSFLKFIMLFFKIMLSMAIAFSTFIASYQHFIDTSYLDPSYGVTTQDPIVDWEGGPATPPPSLPDEFLVPANKVIVDGVMIGIIPNDMTIDTIIENIQEQYEQNAHVNSTVYELLNDITIESTVTFSNNISDIADVTGIISSCLDFKVNSFELLVDNVHIGYFETQEECYNVMEEAQDRFLATYFLGKDVTNIEIDKPVTVKEATVYKDELLIMSFDDAVEIVLSDRMVGKERTAISIDQLDSMFETYTVSKDCLYEDAVNDIKHNGKATITILERLVNYNVNVKSVKVSSIPYSTTYRTNSSLHHSTTKVARNGKNGTQTSTYDDFYVNGKLSSSNLIITNKVAPVTKIVEYGTKINYYEKVTELTGKGYFKWPTTGRITYGVTADHMAIDIASSYGTPILASAAGVISTVEYWPENRGLFVMIEHSNGYSTLYAHMSSTPSSIKKGVKVKQGQVIGYMGRSGNATGVHCHFVICSTKTSVYIDPTTMLYGY